MLQDPALDSYSAMSVATGKRTIFTHNSAPVEVLQHDSHDYLYATPSTLLSVVLVLMSTVGLCVASYLVLNAEEDVKFLRDSAILAAGLVFTLGTFLEAFFPVALGCLDEEINLQKEVSSMLNF